MSAAPLHHLVQIVAYKLHQDVLAASNAPPEVRTDRLRAILLRAASLLRQLIVLVAASASQSGAAANLHKLAECSESNHIAKDAYQATLNTVGMVQRHVAIGADAEDGSLSQSLPSSLSDTTAAQNTAQYAEHAHNLPLAAPLPPSLAQQCHSMTGTRRQAVVSARLLHCELPTAECAVAQEADDVVIHARGTLECRLTVLEATPDAPWLVHRVSLSGKAARQLLGLATGSADAATAVNLLMERIRQSLQRAILLDKESGSPVAAQDRDRTLVVAAQHLLRTLGRLQLDALQRHLDHQLSLPAKVTAVSQCGNIHVLAKGAVMAEDSVRFVSVREGSHLYVVERGGHGKQAAHEGGSSTAERLLCLTASRLAIGSTEQGSSEALVSAPLRRPPPSGARPPSTLARSAAVDAASSPLLKGYFRSTSEQVVTDGTAATRGSDLQNDSHAVSQHVASRWVLGGGEQGGSDSAIAEVSLAGHDVLEKRAWLLSAIDQSGTQAARLLEPCGVYVRSQLGPHAFRWQPVATYAATHVPSAVTSEVRHQNAALLTAVTRCLLLAILDRRHAAPGLRPVSAPPEPGVRGRLSSTAASRRRISIPIGTDVSGTRVSLQATFTMSGEAPVLALSPSHIRRSSELGTLLQYLSTTLHQRVIESASVTAESGPPLSAGTGGDVAGMSFRAVLQNVASRLSADDAVEPALADDSCTALPSGDGKAIHDLQRHSLLTASMLHEDALIMAATSWRTHQMLQLRATMLTCLAVGNRGPVDETAEAAVRAAAHILGSTLPSADAVYLMSRMHLDTAPMMAKLSGSDLADVPAAAAQAAAVQHLARAGAAAAIGLAEIVSVLQQWLAVELAFPTLQTGPRPALQWCADTASLHGCQPPSRAAYYQAAGAVGDAQLWYVLDAERATASGDCIPVWRVVVTSRSQAATSLKLLRDTRTSGSSGGAEQEVGAAATCVTLNAIRSPVTVRATKVTWGGSHVKDAMRSSLKPDWLPLLRPQFLEGRPGTHVEDAAPEPGAILLLPNPFSDSLPPSALVAAAHVCRGEPTAPAAKAYFLLRNLLPHLCRIARTLGASAVVILEDTGAQAPRISAAAQWAHIGSEAGVTEAADAVEVPIVWAWGRAAQLLRRAADEAARAASAARKPAVSVSRPSMFGSVTLPASFHASGSTAATSCVVLDVPATTMTGPLKGEDHLCFITAPVSQPASELQSSSKRARYEDKPLDGGKPADADALLSQLIAAAKGP